MRKQRDSKRVSKFMVYFMGFIMIGSLFGVIFFGFGSSNQTTSYNGFKFIYQGNFWLTSIDDRDALFTFLPVDVENIKVDNNVINRLRNAVQIDATSDFNDTLAQSIALAQYQMGITLNNFNKFVRAGFNEEQSNFPVITCNDATQFVPVVYFKNSNETKVYSQNNCIIAEAFNDRDMARVKDRLVYAALGIIK